MGFGIFLFTLPQLQMNQNRNFHYDGIIGLQSPPEGGYSHAYFSGLIDQMEQQLERLSNRKDPRAVFQLTYLTFSKHVYQNLISGSFTDQQWDTDMCCRFVEIYMHQMRLWDEKSPNLCNTWREALELMEQGKLNVLQCMFLGMNAHINYDLAFCTLGACVAQGDSELNANPGLTQSFEHRGLAERYRDYLQINHVGWRSITHIQDEVLNRFHPILGVFNRWGVKVSKPLSLRVLMASRDQAWRRTALLIHTNTPQESSALARLIDHAALRWSHAIKTISINPFFAHRAIRKWQSGKDVTQENFFSVLLNSLHHNSLVSHLLMAELAFAGAGSVLILEELLRKDNFRGARQWTNHICEYGTSAQFNALLEYFKQRSSANTKLIVESRINSRTPKQRVKPLLKLRKKAINERLQELDHWLSHSAVHGFLLLKSTIEMERNHYRNLNPMEKTQETLPQPLLQAMSEDTNPWLAYLAKGIISQLGGTISEEPIVEAVLFLKDSPIFSSMQSEFLYQLCKHVKTMQFAQGDVLIHQGAASSGIWVIKSGSVAVSGENNKVISQLGAYDVVGELSCICGIHATANVVAQESTAAYFIQANDFMSALHDAPEIAINLLQIMGKRLSATSHTLMTTE